MKTAHSLSTDLRNSILKQKIVSLLINTDSYSIADLSKELGSSIPTVTKTISEMIHDGILEDNGKIDTNGGRRPNIYGLNPAAGYFVGIDVRQTDIGIAVIDFKGNIKGYKESLPVLVADSVESFISMCNAARSMLKDIKINEDSVLAYGVNLSGRVNIETGYCFTYTLKDKRPIGDILAEELGTTVYVENDSRAMTYGEYICGAGNKENQMLFFNITWGLGMGMIIDGKLSYGRSGFSGEIGHFPLLNNDQICHCGKMGCLETGASGIAMHRIITEKLRDGRNSKLSGKFHRGEEITMDDILNAIHDEDVLAIEVMEEVGTTLGRAIAGMINLFNPELIVLGGRLAEAGEYLLLPIKTAIQKHSLNVINRDTTIKFSKLGRKAGPMGACMLSRSKFLGLL